MRTAVSYCGKKGEHSERFSPSARRAVEYFRSFSDCPGDVRFKEQPNPARPLPGLAAGTGTFDSLIDAHRRLVKRKLDACVTPEERVAVWKDAAKTAQEIADDQASRFEAGSVPEVNKLEGSEYQKEVELELAKSKFEAQQ